MDGADLLVKRDLEPQVARAHHELLDGLGARLRRRLLGGVGQLADGQDDRVALVNLAVDTLRHERLQLVVDAARLHGK